MQTHGPKPTIAKARRPVPTRAARQRAGRKRRSVMHTLVTLNMTPMIDIIFNLLIFFIVGTRFAEVEGVLRSELPKAPSGGATASIPLLPIRIRLAPDPATPDGCLIRIDNVTQIPRTFHDLAGLLEELKGDYWGYDSDTPVVIVAGDDVQWQHVVDAFNAGRIAKYSNIQFADG